jgi:uncharacterized membrane protein
MSCMNGNILNFNLPRLHFTFNYSEYGYISHMTSDTMSSSFSCVYNIIVLKNLGQPLGRLGYIESSLVVMLVLLSSVEIKERQLPLQLILNTHTIMHTHNLDYDIVSLLLHNVNEYCTILYVIVIDQLPRFVCRIEAQIPGKG